jgi:peptide-methionine (S)-S-oxide reductase
MNEHTKSIETAVFGGGCFWCTEAVFKMLKGVIFVEPGYAGGTTDNPDYYKVAGGTTGHAEVIKIEFDPSQISFWNLLTVFFATHDPTSLNKQQNDVGAEYRSIVLITNTSQKDEVEKFVKELNASSPDGKPIVTEVKPLEKFYPAEEYHKDYYERNKYSNPYCEIIINPKLEKVQRKFAELLKDNEK